jgi:GTPase-associated protein 1, N-terminal domain type 1
VSAARPPIHQALHGYRDGHRLLASSITIADLDQRQMLALSDSADSRQIDPGAPLLTGYPLPSGEFYVLACTWPALEVRRPGCVWTHSLLLGEQLLAEEGLTELLALFSRPEDDEGEWEEYGKPLKPQLNFKKRKSQELPAVTETVLWSLYEPPAPPIDLRAIALKGSDPHQFLLTIWMQQWPALRGSFSFAQAPRTARRLGEQLFDLQLTTSPQQGSWEEEGKRPAPRTITKPLDRRPPNWCAALRRDLTDPGSLRDFMAEFGKEELRSRAGLWALASIFAALDPSYESGLAGGLRALARVCPEREEAAELKQALFSVQPDPRLPFPVDQVELLLALAAPEHESESGSLAFADRLAGLLKENDYLARQVTERLLELRRSEAAKSGLQAISAQLSDGQIKRWGKEDSALLARLAVQSEQLLSRPALWSSLDADLAWPIVGKPQMAKTKRLAMLTGVLNAGAEEFAEAATRSWHDGTELLLDAIAATGRDADHSRLIEDAKPKTVVSWLRKNGPSPAVAATLLDAWGPKKLEKVPLAEWDHLLEVGGTLSDFTLTLLFLSAVDPTTGLGPKTAVRSFDELYGRLHSSTKFKTKALIRLADAADDRGVDPLEQAANLLATAFVDANWPAEMMLSLEKPAELKLVLADPVAAPLIAALIRILDSSEASKEQGDIVWKSLFASEDVSFVEKALTPIREAIMWPSRRFKR